MTGRHSTIHDDVQPSLEKTFHEYISIYNGDIREALSPSEEEIITRLFATKVSVGNGKIVNHFRISQLKHQFQGFLQAGRKCEIVHFEFLGDRHMEYKVDIFGPNGLVKSTEHSIATINTNNKIVSMEPFSKDGVARILFEIKFREYFDLYDGSPKVFGTAEESTFRNLFAEDFHTTIRREKYNQDEWMEIVKICMEEGMKVDILKFSFARNSTVTFEYKLRAVHKEGEAVVLHCLGTTIKGKFTSFTPYNEKAYLILIPRALRDAKRDGNGKRNAVSKKKKSSLSKHHGGLRGLLVVPTGWERKGYLV